MKKKKSKSPSKPRMPREKGLTELCYYYQQSPPSDKAYLLKNIQNYVIKLYIMNSFTINSNPTPIPTLSQYLQIPLSHLQSLIQQNSLKLHTLINPEELSQSLTNLLSLSATWALEDRGKALQQYHTMSQSQGGTYKPFISSEVNKSIELLLKTNNQFSSLIQALNKDKSPNISISHHNTENNTTNNNLLLDTTQALKLIQQQDTYIPLKENPELLNQHYQDYLIDTPNLDPSKSPGEPQSDKALESGNAVRPTNRIAHEDRRLLETGLNDIEG